VNQLLEALAIYVTVLNRSAKECHRAEDREAYTRHLAAAAELFLAAHAGRIEELRELVAGERHAYGWGYLSHAEGIAAENAFHKFAKLVEATNAT
jgi:hypothetical protein